MIKLVGNGVQLKRGGTLGGTIPCSQPVHQKQKRQKGPIISAWDEAARDRAERADERRFADERGRTRFSRPLPLDLYAGMRRAGTYRSNKYCLWQRQRHIGGVPPPPASSISCLLLLPPSRMETGPEAIPSRP